MKRAFRLYRYPALLLIAGFCLCTWLYADAAVPIGDAPTTLPQFSVFSEDASYLNLGTNAYTLSGAQIEDMARGENSAFNQVLIHTPGVSQDSAGQVHFRQEDPFYQYYINGILLPRGINGFGQDVDSHFIENVSLKVGALPAEYAWGNYGIVSLQTKTGEGLKNGEISYAGGSYETVQPSVSWGGSSGKTDYYFTGGSLSDDLGIENPTASLRAIHDRTKQYKGFAYVSHALSPTSSLSFIASASHADFQIPNNPDQVSSLEFSGEDADFPIGNSVNLNETQTEQSYYALVAYRQTIGDFVFQVAQVNRYSSVLFRPDENGDLYFNGVAGRVFREAMSDGLQGDFTFQASDAHTLRGGLMFNTEMARDHNRVAVFPVQDENIDPANGDYIVESPPFIVDDDHFKQSDETSAYLQDEWKAASFLTLNFGGRFDAVNAYVKESQVSPRVSAVYELPGGTTLHVGYARYFIPPPFENVSPTSVEKFDGTTNAADRDVDDPVKCERSDYYDAGLTHRFSSRGQVSLDGYYKRAKNQIDDGQFGAANIFSPYNFAHATIYGVELSASYVHGGFSFYGNFAASQAYAQKIVSSEFEFDSDELDYIATHEVHLDQTQFFTGSGGISYIWRGVTLHTDLLYGSGMRSGFANTARLPAYCPINLGIEYLLKGTASYKTTVRIDAINLFDQSYVLNDGSGIGVGAPKFGARRGIYLGISVGI